MHAFRVVSVWVFLWHLLCKVRKWHSVSVWQFITIELIYFIISRLQFCMFCCNDVKSREVANGRARCPGQLNTVFTIKPGRQTFVVSCQILIIACYIFVLAHYFLNLSVQNYVERNKVFNQSICTLLSCFLSKLLFRRDVNLLSCLLIKDKYCTYL